MTITLIVLLVTLLVAPASYSVGYCAALDARRGPINLTASLPEARGEV